MQTIGQSLIGHATRIGINRARLDQGKPALARDHLPFNRRERALDLPTIGRIAELAKGAGLSDPMAHNLKGYLWLASRAPDANTEEFILTFNSAVDHAKDIVFDQCSSPHVCWDVFSEICRAIGRGSGRSHITRGELAQRCRLHPEQISRHTGQLERTDPPLLRKSSEARGVVYEVLPPPGKGFPTWRGDRASRLDAQGEVTLERERERQGELLPS